jgi:hydroxymethylpyrimidine pyrophosphatase-like HAD family hydrolase
MGKPFAQELQKISDTYKWALKADLNVSNEYLSRIQCSSTFVVGSGGSLSACYFLSMLQQKAGYISKAITPLDLYYAKETIPSSNIIFISASGKNSDILFAFNLSLEFEPKNILSICMKKQSLLAKQSSKYSLSKVLEFELPSGKDGFLATNSLVAYFTIIKRFFGTEPNLDAIEIPNALIQDVEMFSALLHKHFTLTILYSGWGLPVAVDIESKFTEAGLGNTQMADFRNFAHGRHNWFDKKNQEAAIVALITPDNEEIAEKTLSLLPKNVPVLRIKSSYQESDASIDLLVKSFHLVKTIGNLVSIDPGRPGVPSYGSRLYNLKYGSLFLKEISTAKSKSLVLPITRKVGYIDYLLMSEKEKEFWKKSLILFKKKVQSARFGGVIFDYDGTICDSEDRYSLPKEEIKNKLIYLLENNAIVGIATGRGQSVRNDLQAFIPVHLWERVIIGYYNCSQIGLLNDNTLPEKNTINVLLSQVVSIIKNNDYVFDNILIEVKPKQIEIKIKDKIRSAVIKKSIFDLLVAKFFGQIKILESSHSIDIITADVSKRLIIDTCKSLADKSNLPANFICIGDKGKWPGNDYGLLSSDYSLSVDEVSADPASCWNLASLGIRNSDATLEYLNLVNFAKDGTLKLNLIK